METRGGDWKNKDSRNTLRVPLDSINCIGPWSHHHVKTCFCNMGKVLIRFPRGLKSTEIGLTIEWTTETRVWTSQILRITLSKRVTWSPDCCHLWSWNYYKSQNYPDHQEEHLDYPSLQTLLHLFQP